MQAPEGVVVHGSRYAAQLRQGFPHLRFAPDVELDLDYFKAFNDRYGHLAGDAALRSVAQALRALFRRPLDLLARYGGEEFVGLWYGLSPAQMAVMARDVCETVRQLSISHADSPLERVTVSLGVVGFQPRGDESLLTLIRATRAAS